MIEFSPSAYVIEPANVQTLQCVRSVSLANRPRQIIPGGTESDSVINSNFFASSDLEDAFVLMNTSEVESLNGVYLKGGLTLEAGYNCGLKVDGNRIQINAVPGGGASVYGGQPAEIPVTAEEEQILQTGDYLSGGPKCYELINAVNGIEGDTIPLNGGNGVSIETTVGKIIIRMTADGSAGTCDVSTC